MTKTKKVTNPDNPYDLNEKQLQFCEAYLETFNATQAYMDTYNCTYKNAYSNAWRLMKENEGVKKELMRRKKMVRKNAYVKAQDVFNLIVKIAFSKIDKYIEWGHDIEKVRDMFGNVCKDEKGKDRTYIKNWIKTKSNKKVDSQLIQELSQGKEGFKVKLVDKKWAIECLVKNYDMFPDKWKRKFEGRKLDIMQNIKNKVGDKDTYTKEELEEANRKMMEEFGDDLK